MGKSKKKQSYITTGYYRFVVVLIVIAAIAATVSGALRIHSYTVTSERHNLRDSIIRFMDTSDYLTDEARSYVVTLDKKHYENYWTEVNVTKTREKMLENIKNIGVSPEEKRIVTRMALLSDRLVPLEAQVMNYAANGNSELAENIIFGTYYNNTIHEIFELRNQALDLFDKRAADVLLIYDIADKILLLMIWLIMFGVTLMQFKQKKSLLNLAYRDSLTGLYNYYAFREIMNEGKAVSGHGYVVSADLRGFTTVNLTCGVEKGNAVIIEMGNILKNNINEDELLARVTGDRYVMFMHSNTNEELIERFCIMKDEISLLSQELDVPNLFPKFSVCEVKNTLKPERSYGDANLAKHHIEGLPDRFYVFFDNEMLEQKLSNKEMEDDFDRALEENHFEMWYQPQFSPITGKLVAAEALVRWRKDDGTLISPGKFIPLFEQNGMIARLDEHNFRTVCAQIRQWLDDGIDVVPISVNVSHPSILYDNIAERYMNIVNEYNIPSGYINLEFTESSNIPTEKIADIINDFHGCGFKISIDDFGSGYSSLYLLTRKYYDVIKIDKSIVDCINTASGDSLLKSIVSLAHEFNMKVTAEGVEDEYQLSLLKDLSCDTVQGFYYAKPMIASDFSKML